jgi:putative transposase
MARVVVPSYPYHVTQRGNRRQKTFFCEDDYCYYIELMSEFTKEAGTEIWAYCLMPNHVHLVMVPVRRMVYYLLATVRYVERNPVVARLCRHPVDWKWSSAYAHLMAQDDGLVLVKPMLERVDDWGAYLSSAQDEETQAIQQHTRTGRALGDNGFVQHLELITGKTLTAGRPGPKAKV